jgi:peptidoglycan/xylan/chitin deacetylase (PgdA/CDA1 family)
MWNGKLKAFSFSFDDGILQDKRMVEILDKYGLKGTFFISSALIGTKSDKFDVFGKFCYHQDKLEASEIKELYKNHEVASHTMMHQNLTNLEKSAIIYQVEMDRKILSDICGYEVVGLGYPCGGVNADERVADIVKNFTGIKYARSNRCTRDFSFPPEQPYLLKTSVPVYDYNEITAMAKEFIALKTDTPKWFSVVGHAFELDTAENINWQNFEEFCKLISNKDDIFYGTFKDVLL